MKIELICIGDELLSGRTQDKNGFWLSKFLEENDLSLKRITLIPDDYQEIFEALKNAFSRSSVVILSGGLGPTKDDLTKLALAEYFKVQLVENKSAQKIAERNYRRKGLKFIKESTFYHIIPQNFIPCNNPKGLAPGLIWFNGKQTLLSAPGVPWEFSSMIKKEFIPFLNKTSRKDSKTLGKFTIKTYGVPEEFIFYELVPELWDDLSLFGKVASLPNISGVDIVISQIDKKKFKDFEKKIKNLVLKSPLKPYIWQFGDTSLEEFILENATKKRIKIGVAESATGGLISHRLTNIPGSSDPFFGSIVSYTNKVKIKVLKVKKKTLKNYGAVSIQVAKQMAIGAQRALGVDLAISITGLAGPAGGSAKKPVGLVCIGWALGKENGAESFNFKGDRSALKSLFTQKSLFIMLKKILEK